MSSSARNVGATMSEMLCDAGDADRGGGESDQDPQAAREDAAAARSEVTRQPAPGTRDVTTPAGGERPDLRSRARARARDPQRAQGAHPAGHPRRRARPLRGQQPGGALPAPGGQGGRHRADRLLPPLRLHRVAGAGPGRRVVRLAARDAARRTRRPVPGVRRLHRRLDHRARRPRRDRHRAHFQFIARERRPARPPCARRSGTRSSCASASSRSTSPGCPAPSRGRPRTSGCSPT